ncbi:MAG: histidine kinase [Clostridia bacterium]|nr:histidine kinase [Clostridia bacterium]
MQSEGAASRPGGAPPFPFDTAFQIGRETRSYLRQGLNRETAEQIARVIYEIADVDAVGITDTETILAYIGAGCYFHIPGNPILTNATRNAIRSGALRVIAEKPEFECPVPGCPCPLQSAVIAPLRCRGRVVGTVTLYRSRSAGVPADVIRLATGLAELLSLQLDLAEADRQVQLVTKARLEALQAQIRPHFLFNVLNTIILFSRTDVEKARQMLIHLASFLRRSLSYRSDFITVQEELDYVNTYLFLESARYGDRLRVRMKVDPTALGCLIPILTVQPLVENAVVHGLAPKEGEGRLGLTIRRAQDRLHILVIDDGVGIPPERLRAVFRQGFGTGMGLGLTNVNDRLISLFGADARLVVRSQPGRGTLVKTRLPVKLAGGASVASAEKGNGA